MSDWRKTGDMDEYAARWSKENSGGEPTKAPRMWVRNIAYGGARPVSAAATDSDALAWKAAVVAAGGTVSAGRFTLVSSLIVGLKSDGVWTKLDRLWLHAGENAASALIDLVARASATAINSPTFAIDRGYTGDGASSYINTNIAPSGGVQFTQNSGSTGVYIRNARTTNNAYDAFGSNWLSFNTRLLPRFTDANLYASVNGSAWTSVAAPASVAGIWVLSRTAASSFAVYINGSSFTTSSVTSSALDTANIFVLASGDADGVTPHDLSADQIAMFYMGAGLDATQASNLTTRIQTYMTAVGA